MAIFVTGGAGFIGSQFVRDWVRLYPSQTVINFDRLTYAGNPDNLASVEHHPSYRIVRGDICEPEQVLAALPEDCDAVVHFAAESHVDRSIASAAEFVRTNVLGTQVLLDAARARRVRRFLHISTDEVGGSMDHGQLFREDSPLNPSSPYAASKTAAEHLVRAAAHTFGLDAVVTRTSNNYGPFQFPEKLLPLAITRALAGEPIPVYGDGLQVRDWLYVEDHCRAIFAALERGRAGEIYNIGGSCSLPNIEVIKRILKATGKPESLITRVADRPGHDRRYALTNQKLTNETGWAPEKQFDEGLAATIQWYKDNRGWVDRVKSGEYQRFYEVNYARRN